MSEERKSFPLDRLHYDYIKKQYDAAKERGDEEFICQLPDGSTWPVLTSYCYYLLQHMEHMLDIKPQHSTTENPDDN